jgi:hypothetical protein
VILDNENVASSDDIELPNERGMKLSPEFRVSWIKLEKSELVYRWPIETE